MHRALVEQVAALHAGQEKHTEVSNGRLPGHCPEHACTCTTLINDDYIMTLVYLGFAMELLHAMRKYASVFWLA